MNAGPESDHARLVRAVARLYAESELPMLRHAAEILIRLAAAAPRPGKTLRLPVARFMPAAAAAARRGPLRDIAEALAAVEPASDWLQNPNYGGGAVGPAFLDNYGYVELVGPCRAYDSRDVLMGFLMLGPGTLYPDHGHAAEEVYHVVAGRAAWWREDLGWRDEPPGAAIRHAPYRRHAMRTGDEPLLALYCWSGEIGAAARLTAPDPAAPQLQRPRSGGEMSAAATGSRAGGARRTRRRHPR
jgi:mannose-6-phosphate isomerase-like protein (cupin superfamily)